MLAALLLNSANVISYVQPAAYILSGGARGSVMRSRFEYEAPGLLKKAALTLRAPHKWRSRVRPWVFDKKSGARFQLAEDEHSALRPLTSHMRNGSTSLPAAVAFDEAAAAIMERRRGYCFEWERLAKRTPVEWESWLDGGLRRLRW
jgi:hypothetical protein